MLASERSSPPNQIGRPRTRSLTTIREVGAWRIEISSMPMARGEGVPARASWACMYCISSALTVCQSSASSFATSLIVACRQRRPPPLQLQIYPSVPAGQIAHPADLAVVPAHLDATAAPTRCFFERRLSLITRAFGSPKIPRTVGSGRKPQNEYVSQSRRLRFCARTIRYSCRIRSSAKMQNLLAIPSFLAFSTSKIAHSIPRRPKEKNERKRQRYAEDPEY